MRARATGVDIIDEVLGGITPGAPCVLAGPSGSGRTVLSLQLAAAGVEQGRVVSLLCNEPAPLLLRQASTLGLDISGAIDSERLALLEMDAEVAAITNALGSDALIEAVRAEQPLSSMLIIDPLSVVLAGIFDETHLRAAARALVTGAPDWMIVLTVESERLALQQGLERTLGEICGAFLELSCDESGARELTVAKTRTGVPLRPSVRFEIGDGGTRVVDDPAPAPTNVEVPGAAPSPVSTVAPAESPSPLETHAGRGPAPPGTSEVTRPALPDLAPERVEADPVAPTGAPTPRHAAGLDGATRPSEPASGGEPDRPPVVLLVDSDPQSRHKIVKWLQDGYEIIEAEDGFDAMTSLMTRRPDLVILDLLMPRVTGYELLSAIQRSGQPVPRLVISGRLKRPGDRLGPLVLGATDILAKPMERFELVRKVELLLSLAAPPSQLMDPIEAERLFARISKTRLLEPPEFLDRLDRACNLGERLGLPSSLVAVSARSTRVLDAFLASADESLRFEDATLRVSPRRAVILLVATEQDDAPDATERLCEEFGRRGGQADKLTLDIRTAQRVREDYEWRALFRDRGADEESEADA